MSKPVVTEITATGWIVRSKSLFAVRDGIAVVTRNRSGFAIHVTWVRIARIILVGIVVALVLSGDGSAD
jgi:hypothetical protein